MKRRKKKNKLRKEEREGGWNNGKFDLIVISTGPSFLMSLYQWWFLWHPLKFSFTEDGRKLGAAQAEWPHPIALSTTIWLEDCLWYERPREKRRTYRLHRSAVGSPMAFFSQRHRLLGLTERLCDMIVLLRWYTVATGKSWTSHQIARKSSFGFRNCYCCRWVRPIRCVV